MTYEDTAGVTHLAPAPDMETNCGQPRVLRPASSDVPMCLRCISVQIAREQMPAWLDALRELGRK